MSDWDSEPDQRGSVPLFSSRPDANVDDIYDEKGFFFRQRRGRFNLRKLDQIELDRLVREVDIQTLQEHLEDLTFSIFNEDDLQFYTDRQVVKLFRLAQLTIEYLLYSQTQLVSNMHELSKKYAGKKKTLHRKRRELVGLKEEVSSLYAQLKTKRRNLTTLEKLVKETGKALKPSPQEEPNQDKPISFYVSLPNNVFMELTERPSATVRNVLSQVMNVLLTDRSFDPLAHFDSLEDMQSSPQKVLQLFSKGKLLLLESTLQQCHLQSGDTLVAAYPLAKAPAKQSTKPIQEATRAMEKPVAVPDTGVITGINDIMGKQLKSMEQLAAEMNNCASALNALSKQPNTTTVVQQIDEAKLIEHMDQKLHHMEAEIKENLARVQQVIPPKLIFGEMENDYNEDLGNAIKQVNEQLRQSFSQMDSIKGEVGSTSDALSRISEALRMQQEQLNDLRASLKQPSVIIQHAAAAPNVVHNTTHNITSTPQAPAPAPAAPAPAPVVLSTTSVPRALTPEKEVIQPRPNKWKVVIDQGEGKAGEEAKAVTVDEPAKKEVVDVVDFTPAPKKKEEVKEVKAKPPTPTPAPAPVVSKPPSPSPSTYAITFTHVNNPDLYSVQVMKVVVTVDANMTSDELIFSLRKGVASTCAVPFSAVALVLDKKVIKLGIDIPKLTPFAPSELQAYADSGRLSIKLHKPKTVSDSQLDTLLVPVWQNEHSSGKGGQAIEKKDDVETEELRESLTNFNSMRLSLNDMLRDLSDKEGLTDEEMWKRKKEMEAYSSASDGETLKKHRSSIISAVGTAYSNPSNDGQDKTRTGNNFLRSSYAGGGSVSGSVRNSMGGSLSGSMALEKGMSLLRIKSNKEVEAEDRVEEAEDAGERSVRHSLTLRRSWEDANSYDDNDTPMLSSLNQPILPRASVDKDRYGYTEDATPSYISSLGEDTFASMRSLANANRNTLTSTNSLPQANDRRMIAEEKDRRDSQSSMSYNHTLSTTLTSLPPDSLHLSETMDSADHHHDLKAAQEALEDESVSSPFKAYRGNNTTTSGGTSGGGMIDLDTASVHSLALSDSNNLDD